MVWRSCRATVTKKMGLEILLGHSQKEREKNFFRDFTGSLSLKKLFWKSCRATPKTHKKNNFFEILPANSQKTRKKKFFFEDLLGPLLLKKWFWRSCLALPKSEKKNFFGDLAGPLLLQKWFWRSFRTTPTKREKEIFLEILLGHCY